MARSASPSRWLFSVASALHRKDAPGLLALHRAAATEAPEWLQTADTGALAIAAGTPDAWGVQTLLEAGMPLTRTVLAYFLLASLKPEVDGSAAHHMWRLQDFVASCQATWEVLAPHLRMDPPLALQAYEDSLVFGNNGWTRIRFFAEIGCDVLAPLPHAGGFRTPLRWLWEFRDVARLEELLAAGADPHTPDAEGWALTSALAELGASTEGWTQDWARVSARINRHDLNESLATASALTRMRM